MIRKGTGVLPRAERARMQSRRGRRFAYACLSGIALGPLLIGVLPPRAYRQDLQVDYLMARALLDGEDIYAPITELSSRYFPAATDTFPHPSPHPPILAALCVPMAILPYSILPPLWLVWNIGLLLLIGRHLGFSYDRSLLFLAWPPLWCVLYIGQFEVVVLALALLAWKSADSGGDSRAGLCLGLAAALKLYPIFFLIPHATRRRLRLVLVAGATFVAAQAINLALVGWSGLHRYYFEILPHISSLYASLGLNSSPYGALLRLFGGASDVAPLFHAPGAVLPITVGLSAFALFALTRLDPLAAPLATLVALPIAWYYSVVVALPQLIRLVGSRVRMPALVAAALASVVLPGVNLLIDGATARWPTETATLGLPALLLILQPVGLVSLLVLSLMIPATSTSRRATTSSATAS